MKCLPVIILAVLLVATKGNVLPADNVENQQTDPQPLQLDDYIREAQTRLENMRTQFSEQIQSLNNEEVMHTMKTQTDTFLNNLRSFVHNKTEEIQAEHPELLETWTNMGNKLREAFSHPETTEDLNQLRTKFREGVQTIMTESENIAKTFNENSNKVQEGISKFTKQAIDIATQAAQNLNNHLRQSTPAPQTEN